MPDRALQRGRLHDLHQIGADHQHVAVAESNADPKLAVTLDRVQHRALNPHRLAGRLSTRPPTSMSKASPAFTPAP